MLKNKANMKTTKKKKNHIYKKKTFPKITLNKNPIKFISFSF